jgi:hypothetical protein
MWPWSLLLVLVLLPARADNQDPGVALWHDIRAALAAPDGERYFESSLKDALVPGGVNRLPGLRGTLIGVDSKGSSTKVILSMERDAPAEVTLKVSGSGRRLAIGTGKRCCSRA